MQGVRIAKDKIEAKKVTEDQKQVWRYWKNCVKRAEKAQPKDQWKAAEDRLKCKSPPDEKNRTGKDEPYVNGFRLHYEGLKSFLDQSDADFKITPSNAFISDPQAIKYAECDEAYLSYIWAERKCQVVESQKLDSVITRNVGVTIVGFDKKKWMPILKYLPAANLLFDPDCGGIRANAKWEGYKEQITVEELKAKNPALTDSEIKKIKEKGGSVLDETEKAEDDKLDKKMFTVITLYHIFARNDAAIRKLEDDEEQTPSEEVAKELNLATPKRYLQLVEGLKRALRDTDGWPYELDDHEFPTTILKFNTPVEDSFGFTDYIQMKQLDIAFDNVMHDLVESAYWEANKKFGGTPEAADLTRADVEAFLIKPKKVYLPKIIGSDGKSKIQWLDTGKFSPELVAALKVISEQREKASSLGELLATEASQYKDVTAFGVSVHDANVHQKVNRRLGGPEGYEASIAEDAIKMLEIAHQFVPRYSLLEMLVPRMDVDGSGVPYETEETYLDYVSLPWQQAVVALTDPNVKLIKLGADAIVGPELAPYWRTADECPPQLFKLSTKVRVLPGSTRTITKEQRAAVLKAYYTELFGPLYQAMGRWDLAWNYIGRVCNLIGLSGAKDLIPDKNSIQQSMRQAQTAQVEVAGGKGGQSAAL